MARPEPTAPIQPSYSESDSQQRNDQVYHSQVPQQISTPDPVQFQGYPPQNPQPIPVDYTQHVPQNNPMHGTIPGQYLPTGSPCIGQPVQYPGQHVPQNNPMHGTSPGQYVPPNPPCMGQPTQYPGQQTPRNYPFPANTQPFPPPQHVTVNYETHINGPSIQQGPATPVIMVQPPPYLRPAVPVDWSTGIFDCLDDPANALITLLFPCMTFGHIAEIVDNGSTSCVTSGLLYSLVAFLIGWPCLLSCVYRTKLRRKYGLVESPAPDWITHFVCEYCALCQEYRELQNRMTNPSIGWHGNQNVQHYQVAMVPPMNQHMRG